MSAVLPMARGRRGKTAVCFVCPTCPPNDDVWHGGAFRAWAAALRGRPMYPCCDACLFARYPRVYRSCSECGGLMAFHSKRSNGPRGRCLDCRLRGAEAA